MIELLASTILCSGPGNRGLKQVRKSTGHTNKNLAKAVAVIEREKIKAAFQAGNYSGAKSIGKPANAVLMEAIRLRPCLPAVDR